jgi:hypothetical protein
VIGMKSVVVPDGSILLDTSQKLTASVIAAVKKMGTWNGMPIVGFIRYVSLYTINTNYDISTPESDLVLGSGYYLGLVQHCLEAPKGHTGWTASVQQGQLKGQTANNHANLIVYPSDSMLGYDDEDVESGDIAGEITTWVEQISPRPPLAYVGFAAGLNSAQLWALPSVHGYWKDAGPREVDNCGFMLEQQAQISIGGMPFDPNIARADKLGRRVVFAQAA